MAPNTADEMHDIDSDDGYASGNEDDSMMDVDKDT